MSELIAPQQQLAAAINQLSQGSSNNRLTPETVDVLVRQITGNQLILVSGNREVLLPRQQLIGELRAGQTYQVALTQNPSSQTSNESRAASPQQTLSFFTRTNLSLDIPLSNNQSQSLIAQLPIVTQRQIANASQVINARVVATTPNILTLELSNLTPLGVSTHSSSPLQLTLATPNTQQNYTQNQSVQLRLTSQNNQLNVTVSAPRTIQQLPLSSIQPAGTLGLASQTTDIISRFVQRPINTSLQEIVPALRSAITLVQPEENRPLNTEREHQTNRSINSGSQPNSSSQSTARLSFGRNGISIATNAEVERATFEQITPQQLRQLSTLSIAAQNTNINQSSGIIASHQPEAADTSVSSDPENVTIQRVPLDETPSESFLRQIISSGNKQALLTQVQSLIRQTRPLTESPSNTLGRIETALSDPDVTTGPDITKLIKDIKNQLTLSLSGNNEDNSEAIKQLVSGTPAHIKSAITTPPSPSNSLINGLIGLLQITLASRLNLSNARTIERITQSLSPLLASGIGPKNARQQVVKSLSDISQIDQKHMLLRELSKFFAGHQNYKLSSIEQQLNSQEGLYYVLPIAYGEHRKDIELLIKRQQDNENEDKKQASTNRAWQVNMKLDIGDKGQLLAKANLKEKDVEIDFYASNAELKSLVFDFIPLLRERFKSLGIQITKHQCQLGKIPESLQRRPYQILETRV
jgi:hypothetical protein